MSTTYRKATDFLTGLLEKKTVNKFEEQLNPRFGPSESQPLASARIDQRSVERRWEKIPDHFNSKEALLDSTTLDEMECYSGNIENFIGSVTLPVGIAGPLRINGTFASGDYLVPLATTEAALVASYNRGARLLTKAGGCRAVLLSEGVSRSPAFAFKDLTTSAAFAAWALPNFEQFKEISDSTSSHCKLTDLRLTIEGNHVYLEFEYFTGDAAGQNMVTIATEAVCYFISENSPVAIDYFFVEANLSGDKKASAQSFLSVRGKKVTCEVVLPKELVEKKLHTTPLQMTRYWQMSAIGGVQSGTVGIQGHYANSLAALFIACGQDAACVAEAAVGVTRMELTESDDLYVSVTLPNLIVGTVGGGTSLPSQKACLNLLYLPEENPSKAFAEICAATALAGEISIIGALAAGDFTKAHRRLAREKGKAK